MRHAMIMAGGAGTRLWPMSRRSRPKQLLPLIGGRSLLAAAADRLDGVVDPGRRLVCTAEAYRGQVRAAIPALSDEQILGEPVGRDTMNAVGLTAAVLAARDPDAIFAVLTSDHVIEPATRLGAALDLGFRLVEADASRLVTFSIVPDHPATGFGYVRRGAAITGFDGAFAADAFREKPDLETAEAYLEDPAYGWNSGMFVFHARTLLDALARFHPRNAAGLARIAEAWDGPDRTRVLAAIYPELPKTSVDYGIMEPAARDDALSIAVVPVDVAWIDVGSWPSYAETLEADADGNRTNARTLHVDGSGILAVSDDPGHLIATAGCRDLVIVHTRDATLVCTREAAQQVKAIAERVPEDLR